MLKLSDNASDIVVVSDVKRDVISPITYHMRTQILYTTTHKAKKCNTTSVFGYSLWVI